MPTVLITGANRGIGLEFARRYAAAGWEVIGAVRDPDAAGDLREVARVEQLDVTDLDRVESFADRLEGPLNLFIANAGTYGPRRIETAADGEGWLDTLNAMAVSPVLLAERLLDNLEAAKGKAAAITSKMGSIDDNSSGGFIAYRSAKAALNAAWTSLAIDNPKVAFVLLHPGWVQTRMGGTSAPTSVGDSVAGMMRVIEDLEPAGRAPFLDFTGETVPW
jgi:NAD(P)-dependent dehydrogenase (short-subunit alcohol dehydrogenase family)